MTVLLPLLVGSRHLLLLSGSDTGLMNSIVVVCLTGTGSEALGQGEVSVSITLGQEMTRKVALRRERALPLVS